MKKITNRICRLFLPTGVTIGFLVPFSFSWIFYVFIAKASTPEKILALALAAYTLTVLLVRIPDIVNFLKSLQKNNKFVNRFTTDPFLRVKISLPTSIIFDIIYAVIQCIIGMITLSFWFYVLACYYVMLAIMRLVLFREFRPSTSETKNSLEVRLFVGISLFIMNIALAAIVYYIVNFERGFTTGWLFSLAIVSYTIGALITAIVGLTKYRRLKSPALTASKVINFTAAAISILILETVLIDTFGSEKSCEFRRIITSITGTGVCTFVLILSLYLIFSPGIIKKKRKHNNKKEKAKM